MGAVVRLFVPCIVPLLGYFLVRGQLDRFTVSLALQTQAITVLSLITIISGWRFRRSDVALIGLITALMAIALVFLTPGARLTPGRQIALQNLVWTTGQALILLMACLPDRGLLSRSGGIRTALILFPTLLLGGWILAPSWLPTPVDHSLFRSAFGTDLAPIVMTGITMLVMLIRYFIFNIRISGAFFWSALITGLAFGHATGTDAVLLMLTALVVLFLGSIEQLIQVAFEDELTRLPSRRALNRTLSGLRPPFAIAVVDVDHFKRFNDRYGHDVGDEVLRKVAARLHHPGSGGRSFRAGGEEFVMIFANRTSQQVLETVEDVRKGIETHPFHFRNPRNRKRSSAAARNRSAARGSGARITVSIGLADSTGGQTAQQVLKKADKALYRAKKSGRNRTCR